MMTIGEANDVQRLLDWVLDVPHPAVGFCADDEAGEIATRLADRSYKVLSAGRRGDKVRAAWPHRPPRDTPREAGDG